jgi:hypothetical protein
MSELTPREREEFFKRLGFRDGKPLVERRGVDWHVTEVNGHVVEYRSAPRAAKRKASEYRQRLERLERECRELDLALGWTE